ncbi:MAG: T9SS type A sorting domain-containing protein [Bacteroidales bacterium]|nr:T9SS type A sorting domain-containing protein [Bacteroidales bacterium]
MKTGTYKYILYGMAGLSLILLILNQMYLPVQQEKTIEKHEKERNDNPEKFAEYFYGISTPIGQKVSGYPVNYKLKEYEKAKKAAKTLKYTETYPWVQRGPGNVSGRTRALIVDPDDPAHSTWFAGSASGGIWKTTNAGSTWECLTDNFPVLSTSALAMAGSNHNILYAGTGEGYVGYPSVVGNGIFRSSNKGQSWTQLSSTILNENFRFVNKLAVNPVDENMVIACTNTGIFKSADGGTSWDTVFANGSWVQDIAVHPLSFDTLYATVNTLGIIKSVDAGEHWELVSDGIGSGFRYTLSISPVNQHRLFSLVEAPDNLTELYTSNNGGESWMKLNDSDDSFIQVLKEQGGYDNIVRAHPYDEHTVFLGGVYLSKVEFQDTEPFFGDTGVMRATAWNTGSFLSFVNFGGSYLNGGLSTGDEEGAVGLIPGDWTSVEIRFGNNLKQKAHRFTVPVGAGPGVPASDYTYKDYIEVPFQVWDVKNNRQLMVSFRDQERDGEFNLVERDPYDELLGREYIFIHAVEYDDLLPHPLIDNNGGHTYKMLYFMWPELPANALWEPESLPVSNINVTYGAFTFQDALTTPVSTAAVNNNLHVDHHELIMIPTNVAQQEFAILNGNDGGIGISYDNGESWEQITNGYLTTQFYGVAKKPGAHEYIGGMQDNGTWQSPLNTEATINVNYLARLGGDGFETLWHPLNPSKIIASIYNNQFYLTTNGGSYWRSADSGIDGDGPFFSRLSHSKKNPEVVFAVGTKGVYRHRSFASPSVDWQLIPINNGWNSESISDYFFNVRVSLADSNIVWAGAAMYDNPELNIFVSQDVGSHFSPASNYTGESLGVITGIATHPFDKNTAYLLFSYNTKPKILRTTNLGDSWEDITGFEGSETSANGFPDVMVFSLLVMPYDTERLWAGTEIGIFESLDNGISWHFADYGLPAVSIWQMEIVDHELVVATHGRGIWTLDLSQIYSSVPENTVQTLKVFPNPAKDQVEVLFDNEYVGEINLQLFDIKGRTVLHTRKVKSDYVFRETLEIENLPKGDYILKIYTDKNSYSEKLVKR